MESPLERALQHYLRASLTSDVTNLIKDFIGNKTHYKMSGVSCLINYIMQNNIIRSDDNTNYSIFTATHSTIICVKSLTDFYDTKKIDLWPQTWQLIPLSSGIDLEQVLFDFDMSCVECAFNGTNVVVTP